MPPLECRVQFCCSQIKEWLPEGQEPLKRWKTHLKGENLHPKGSLMCLPEQGAILSNSKSSSGWAAGTSVVSEDQKEKKSSPANCRSVIYSTYGEKEQNWWTIAQGLSNKTHSFLSSLCTFFLVNSTIRGSCCSVPRTRLWNLCGQDKYMCMSEGKSKLSSCKDGCWVTWQWEGMAY